MIYRGAKHRVDYSVHIWWDRERYLLYYIQNYWNKNCKPQTIKSLRTNQYFYFFKPLRTVIKQPSSPPALFITCEIWPAMRYNSYKCKLVAFVKQHYHYSKIYCNSLPITILQFIILWNYYSALKNDKKESIVHDPVEQRHDKYNSFLRLSSSSFNSEQTQVVPI